MKAAVMIHLCFVFTFLAGVASQPFMGDLFAYKSASMVYQTLMGNQELLQKIDHERAQLLAPKMEHFRTHFKSLPSEQQEKLLKRYRALQELAYTPWTTKCVKAYHLVFFDLPALERLWIAMSIIFCVLLIRKREGAATAAWLVPLLACACILDNAYNGIEERVRKDYALFPSEKYLIQNYGSGSLKAKLSTQGEDIKKAWELFLVTEYAKQQPSQDLELFYMQVEDGEFQFLNAQALLIEPSELGVDRAKMHQKAGIAYNLFFLSWNCCFAWLILRKKAPYPKPLSKKNTPMPAM